MLDFNLKSPIDKPPPCLSRFVEALSELALEGCFNPWADTDDQFDLQGPAERRDRLIQHLACPAPALILVGEAPGYQGARFSGIPFTSEALVLDGAIPRVASPGERITSRERPWSEPSATIMWETLYGLGLESRTLLWNACPLHPMPPGKPHGNRKPSAAEVAAGEPFLKRLLELFPKAEIGAVGRTSEGLLANMGIEAVALRHPAYGGKAQFQAGLAERVSAH